MQTSQLLSSLLNRTTAATPKQIELSPGQVFKGTVLKLHPNQMATVQIGGMQVNARLETNLEAGQRAWLQVQPANAGVVTLKVLQDTASPKESQDASMQELMRSLGVAESSETSAILRALVKQHMPVNREAIQAFAQISKDLGVNDATIDAFLLAMRRQMPLTKEVVGSLKTFLSGQSLTDAIGAFLSEADQFLQQQDAGKPAGNRPTAQQSNAAQQTGLALKDTLQALKDKLTGLPFPIDAGTAGEADTFSASAKLVSGSLVQNTSAPSIGVVQTTGKQEVPQQIANSQANSVNLQKAEQSPPSISSQGGVSATKQADVITNSAARPANEAAKAAADANSTSAGAKGIDSTRFTSTERAGAAAATHFSSAVQMGSAEENQTHSAQKDGTAGTAGQANKADLIKDFFQRLGIAHERDLATIHADPAAQTRLENVKSMLLQLTQAPSGSIPTSLREAAESLIQQVTGQQLMMVQPPNQTLSQVVMQIPFRTREGDETAYVQVEAKRRESGQLDPENCRLFFNLHLERLGITMIDVAIVNRIVNVQIFNDQPWLEGIVQQLKETFSAQLQETGYHLSGMRVQSIPEARTSTSTGPAKMSLLTNYQGMDIRV